MDNIVELETNIKNLGKRLIADIDLLSKFVDGIRMDLKTEINDSIIDKYQTIINLDIVEKYEKHNNDGNIIADLIISDIFNHDNIKYDSIDEQAYFIIGWGAIKFINGNNTDYIIKGLTIYKKRYLGNSFVVYNFTTNKILDGHEQNNTDYEELFDLLELEYKFLVNSENNVLNLLFNNRALYFYLKYQDGKDYYENINKFLVQIEKIIYNETNISLIKTYIDCIIFGTIYYNKKVRPVYNTITELIRLLKLMKPIEYSLEECHNYQNLKECFIDDIPIEHWLWTECIFTWDRYDEIKDIFIGK